MLFSHSASNAIGVEILFKNGFDISVDSVKADPQGRFLVVKGKIHDKEYAIVNVYAPNSNTLCTQFLCKFTEGLVGI